VTRALRLAPAPLRRVLAAHLESRHVSRVIYGATIGLALVLALEDHSASAPVVVGSLLATALAITLAEVYSDIVGTEARTHKLGLGRGELRRMLGEVTATAFGVAFPAVFFAGAAADVFSLDTAFTVAKWSGLALIAFYGFCAARLAGARLPAALVHAVAVALIGGLLIVVKSLLH
jgi:hypothetical protein